MRAPAGLVSAEEALREDELREELREELEEDLDDDPEEDLADDLGEGFTELAFGVTVLTTVFPL